MNKTGIVALTALLAALSASAQDDRRPRIDVDNYTIDVQINRLRRKIESDPTNPIYLQTARGSGYKLVVDP